MKTSFENHDLFKALAEPSRVQILNALLNKPLCVEELSVQLQLAESTVSFHLKKLTLAQLIYRQKDQYYAIYTPNLEILEMTLGELIRTQEPETQKHEEQYDKYKKTVLKSFIKNGKLTHIPVQKKKRMIILNEILSKFKPNAKYTEKQVNEIITRFHSDFCTIRREFICEKLMGRENQMYWVLPQPLKPKPQKEVNMSNRKNELKKEYKQNPPVSGIFKITNLANNKIFIGKALDVRGKLNGQESQLRWNGHPNKMLQKDWNEFGPEHFKFEILDTLKSDNLSPEEQLEELNTLEALWLDKLKPFENRGYHKIKTRDHKKN